MAKITKLVMITCTAFLERQKPVSTMAKPSCMKNTREPPNMRKKRLRAVLTWPSSATVSAALGRPAQRGRDGGRTGPCRDRPQPLLPHIRGLPRVLHAGRLRHGGDRLLPLQE